MNSERILEELEATELLEVQQRLLSKLRKKPFVMGRKTTYEPLLELVKTLFITEYPDYKYSRKLAQLFYETDVHNIHSNYRYFQDVGLWYLSYTSKEEVKEQVWKKLTENTDPMLYEKRLKRILSEEHLKAALKKYENAEDPLFHFYYGTAVISKAMQILVYPSEDMEQKERLTALIEEMVGTLNKVLPHLKTV